MKSAIWLWLMTINIFWYDLKFTWRYIHTILRYKMLLNTFVRTKQHKKEKKNSTKKTAIYSLAYIYIKQLPNQQLNTAAYIQLLQWLTACFLRERTKKNADTNQIQESCRTQTGLNQLTVVILTKTETVIVWAMSTPEEFCVSRAIKMLALLLLLLLLLLLNI